MNIKQDIVKISIRLSKSPAIMEYFEDTFRTRNYGAERAAEIYPVLREEALSSLQGLFSFEELDLLAKLMESAIDRFEISKEIFIQKIKETLKIRTSFKPKEKEKIGVIVHKIEMLSFYQAVILSEWLCSYHSLSETYKGQKKRKMSFRKYAEKLI